MKRFIALSFSLLMFASVCCMFFAFPVSAAETSEEQILDPVGTYSVGTSETGIYHDIYDLIVNAFYGTSEINGAQELVVTVLATSAVSFVFLVPFLCVVFAIKLFFGR